MPLLLVYKLLDNVPKEKAPEPPKEVKKAPKPVEVDDKDEYQSMNSLGKSAKPSHSTKAEPGKQFV